MAEASWPYLSRRVGVLLLGLALAVMGGADAAGLDCSLGCRSVEQDVRTLRAELKRLAAELERLEAGIANAPAGRVYVPAPRHYRRPEPKGRTTEQELQLIWKQLDELYLTVDRLRQAISP